MAEILEHGKVDDVYYLMKITDDHQVGKGQFYMVYSPNERHLLGRPFSVYDAGEGYVEFLYQVVGKGTEELSRLKKGDSVKVFGPYGNTFPAFKGKKIACIGGGVGIAPFYYYIKDEGEKNQIALYLGLNEGSEAEKAFEDLPADLVVQKGGYITDGVPYDQFDIILTCGPTAMMEKVVQAAIERSIPVYVSMEERMGCGFGACLGCTCKTASGNRRVCKDGPIFRGEEVFYEGT